VPAAQQQQQRSTPMPAPVPAGELDGFASPPSGWAPQPPSDSSGGKRFVPYLSDPSLLDDPEERAAATKRKALAATRRIIDDDPNDDNDIDRDRAAAAAADDEDVVAAAAAEEDAEPRRKTKQGAVTSWTKALILSAAIIVIGAFAWYAVERFIGPDQWVVKFSAIALLIGMMTATAMIGAGRTGAAGKIVAALAAMLAIVCGKALILRYPEFPPELMHFADPAQWARDFARLAFKPIDGLFAGLAIVGIAVRFILSQRE
jgi:hypothetical protein